MIIVRLKGGLGNQMFRYAAARALSAETKQHLKFDISFYRQAGTDTPRAFVLSDYMIIGEEATDSEIASLEPGFFCKLISRLNAKFNLDYHYSFHRLKTADRGLLVDEHLNSFRYFEKYPNLIRTEFRLKNQPSQIYNDLEKEIKAEGQSVAIHIRRGDYAANSAINNYHGTCLPEYYYQAIKLLSGRIKISKLFIFSDDVKWVKANLKFDYPCVYISRPGLSETEELQLMKTCNHQVIANSSFSWWGAWLNENPNKIVIAPKKWLAKKAIALDDLIPSDWITI